MKPLLTQVFGPLLPGPLSEQMQGVLLECVEADRKKHKVVLHLRSAAPLTGTAAEQLTRAVADFFVGYSTILLRSFFDYEIRRCFQTHVIQSAQ